MLHKEFKGLQDKVLEQRTRAKTAEAKVKELEQSLLDSAFLAEDAWKQRDTAEAKVAELVAELEVHKNHEVMCAEISLRHMEQQRDDAQDQVRVLRTALEAMFTLDSSAAVGLRSYSVGDGVIWYRAHEALAATAPSNPAGLQCTCPTIGGYDHSAMCEKAPSPSSPAEERFGVHYDTVPHNPCYDPTKCDCECPGCVRAKAKHYGQWPITATKEATP